MANFTPSKKTPQDFNDGVQYVNQDLANNIQGDEVQADTINNLVESALYSQDQAESAKQTAQGALSQVELVLEDKTLLPEVQKNFYNLGAFDTYVSNGDGTGIVQRKMGYTSLENFNWIEYTGSDPKYIGIFEVYQFPEQFQIKLPSSSSIAANIKVQGFSTIPFYSSLIPDYSIALSAEGFLYIKISNTITKLAQLQPYIQGKILEYEFTNLFQHTEQVIENQPIHIANQEECLYWHEEWRKGLNLLSNDNWEVTKSGITAKCKNGLITFSGTSTSPVDILILFDTIKANKPYTFYAPQVENMEVFLYNAPFDWNTNKRVRVDNGGNPKTFTVDYDISGLWIYFPSKVTLNSQVPFMLTEGSRVYPYEPYNGRIVRKKDLSGVQLFPEGVNPAQAIGGDWEDKGTITTSNSTVLHAYRRL